MGISGIWQWVVVLIVILLLFGTKKLGNMGSDIGKAIKGFKDGVRGANEEEEKNGLTNNVIDSEVDNSKKSTEKSSQT